ncbi:MAG: H-type lectin domain-containing protein [Rhodobacteraceae bacterium]|nr:H-type lectin domain-containing protein [Paracoccaceae bacterium]
MLRLRGASLGVEQGSKLLFADFKDGGVMWTGEGAREMRHAILFSEKFLSGPAVQVSLSMWDMDQRANQRADLVAEEITAEGFIIVFRTWGDTRVARVRADWLALGPVWDDEEWALN